MYITNQPDIAQTAQAAGVDRIFVDLEHVGKTDRQGGMDTVQSRHCIQDIKAIRQVIDKAELLVRCNPIHEATEEHLGSEAEINEIIACNPDIIMLPYFKTAEEVKTFLNLVNGRVKTMLLFETKAAVKQIADILALPGIDEVYIGLNDLSLSYGQKFMFQPLADGTVDELCRIFQQKGLPYGFGGIAAIGKGLIPAEYVIAEHYRLGSSCAILSRSFCDVTKLEDCEKIKTVFQEGIWQIRAIEEDYRKETDAFFEANHVEVCNRVQNVVASCV